MKFNMTQIRMLITCVLVLFTSEALTAKPVTDLPKAMSAAKEQGKPIFIYLYDSFWGIHCRVLEENPNANREFAKLANKFIIAYLDTKNGRAEFVPRLKVERNQTYALALNSEGQEIARMENPETLEKIIILLEKALKKRTQK